ncbi:MAG: hypothetical protein KDA80_01505, partial [Planctomycetaceae bacterium]|nr:hypothetical protein [Planctomycetaceae bacterium]
AAVNDKIIFRATYGATGTELWISDGSGPSQLIDINPGSGSASPSGMTLFQGELFFSANDGTNGSELWKTDGTAANTVQVANLNPGSASSSPGNFAVVGSQLFFRANDGANGLELWKTDGTAANTVQVKDIRSGSSGSNPALLTNVNGTLFFTANDGANGTELWKSDGTAANTVLVKDIDPGSDSSNIQDLTNFNGRLVFTARDHFFYQYSPYIRENNQEVWVSDGTTANTTVLTEIRSGNNGSYPGSLTVSNGSLFFGASNGTSAGQNGSELWKTDGTAANTVQVADIRPGNFSSGPRDLTDVNGTLFFRANDGTNGNELFKSDGTAANTVQVRNISPGSGSSFPQNLINVNGTLFFQANDGTNGFELWKSDGTSGGTTQLPVIGQGTTYPGINNVTNVNGTLFFSANDQGYSYDHELWKANTTTVTKLIAGGNDGSDPANFVDVNGIAFFTADDGTNGVELFMSDGVNAPVLVKNINPGAADSNPRYLTNVNGTLFFQANDGSNGLELWKSDGTAANTVLVRDIRGGANISSGASRLTNVNGTLFFRANDGVNGTELWKSDGTAANTVQVRDIRTGAGSSSFPDQLTNVNGTLLFTANNGTNGRELWKTDGTSANTVLVRDINPGGGYSYASNLTNVNGTLFFTAHSGDYDYELWKSDGTAANTVLVKNINPTGNSSATQFTDVNGILFFRATDGTNGIELWKSDGTAANTVQVRDIVTGSGSGFPVNLTNVNGTLFFRANDGVNGAELWKSDGTTANTVQVADIRSGSQSGNPDQFVNSNGVLYFTADNGVNGSELWRSTGSSASLAADVAPGAPGSSPTEVTSVNDRIFFQAAVAGIGRELVVFEFVAVPTTTADLAAGVLTVTDSDGNDTDDSLTLSYNAGTYTLTDTTGALIDASSIPGSTGNGTSTVTFPDTGITSLVFDTGDGDDSLTIDFGGGGNPIPTGGLTFTAGGQTTGDSLIITGNPTAFGTATFGFTNNNDGTVDLDGSTINYTGLEPIDFSGSSVDNLVLNFTSAKGEIITLSDDGNAADGISTIDSTEGESLAFPTPNVSLTVNTEASGGSGADLIHVEGLDSTFDANLTVQAGTDDTLNFQTNPTVLNGGSLLAKANEISVTQNVTTTGSGSISLATTAGITVTGATIAVASGDLTLSANLAGTATGPFVGIQVVNSTIQTSGTGNISIVGAAGDDAASSNLHGVSLSGGSVVESTVAGGGSITLTGTGGDGDGSNHGVSIAGAGTKVMSAEGAIEVIGAGGSNTGSQNFGVSISGGAAIQSTGKGINAATIKIDGTGGSGTDSNAGTWITDSGTSIVSINGNMEITGTGGNGTGTNNGGVILSNGSVVESTGTGANAAKIAVGGTGGPGTTGNIGILVMDAGSKVVSIDGPIALTGQGDGTADQNSGIEIQGAVAATGSATITVHGTAGAGTTQNVGVRVGGTGATISSADGTVSITGIGAGSGSANTGIEIFSGASLESTGIGNVTISGTGGAGTDDNLGVSITDAGTSVLTSSGTISLTGQGAGSGTGNEDLALLFGATLGGATTSGAITINADSATFAAGTSIQSSGDLAVFARTKGTTIGLGGGAGSLNLDDTELGILADGFSSITIGAMGSLGSVNVETATFQDALTINGGTIHVDGLTAVGSPITLNGTSVATPAGVAANSITGTLITINAPVAPGGSPGQLVSVGDLTFGTGSLFGLEIDGITPGDGFDQIIVTGAVTLTGAGLESARSVTPAVGTELVIIDNDGVDPVVGTFNGLPEGAKLTINKQAFEITYVGGDGNDVALIAKNDGNPHPNDILLFDETALRFKLAINDGAGQFDWFQTNALPVNINGYDSFVGDFDGDGDLDGVVRNRDNNNVNLYTNDGTGSLSGPLLKGTMGTAGTAKHFQVGDYDGNGRDEILWLYTDGKFAGSVFVRDVTTGTFYLFTANPSYDFFITGDVNGDGFDDLVGLYDSIDNTRTNIIPFYSILSNNPLLPRRLSPIPTAGGGPTLGAFGKSIVTDGLSGFRAADLNGDGFDDIVAVTTMGATPGQVLTATATGKTAGDAMIFGTAHRFIASNRAPIFAPMNFPDPILVGQFNSDFRADLFSPDSSGGLFVSLATVNPAFLNPVVLNDPAVAFGNGIAGLDYIVGDFNGDGFDDVVAFGANATVYQSNGTSAFGMGLDFGPIIGGGVGQVGAIQAR